MKSSLSRCAVIPDIFSEKFTVVSVLTAANTASHVLACASDISADGQKPQKSVNYARGRGSGVGAIKVHGRSSI